MAVQNAVARLRTPCLAVQNAVARLRKPCLEFQNAVARLKTRDHGCRVCNATYALTFSAKAMLSITLIVSIPKKKVINKAMFLCDTLLTRNRI